MTPIEKEDSFPIVSVVIPAKDEELYIARCLDSVLEQDYPKDKLSIVVVDNGSTDSTKEIVRDYKKRVTLLEKNSGTIAAVRNHGVTFKESGLVAFLDADCVVPRTWITVALSILREDDYISCVGFAMSTPSENSSWVERFWYQIGNSSRHHGTVSVDWLCSFNLVVKRNYFRQVGGFDEKLSTGEDFDFGIRLNRISNIYFSDRIYVEHLDTVDSLYGLYKKEFWRGKKSIRNFFNSKGKKKEVLSVVVPVIYVSNYVSFVFSSIVGLRSLLAVNILLILGMPFLVLAKKQMLWHRLALQGWCFFSVYLFSRGVAAFF